MHSYLNDVIEEVFTKYNSLENTVFVLPSNRSIRTAKSLIAEKINTPIFSPRMLTIEQFMQEISGLNPLSEFQQKIKLYEVYKSLEIPVKESFPNFLKWCNMVLGDFNEIDRYLIDDQRLFNYLIAIERIEHWKPENNKTSLVSEYLEFSKMVAQLYSNFQKTLLLDNQSNQGFHYRIASKKIEEFVSNNTQNKFLFIGLNALNSAEKLVIGKLLEYTDSRIYWDLDNYFYQDTVHEASFFIRKNVSLFSKNNEKQVLSLSQNYLKKSKISITGTPKNNAQAQFVGQLINEIYSNKRRIALVLADEAMLPLVLNALPKNLENYNVSMGYPTRLTQIVKFIKSFLKLLQNQTEKGFYYKDVLSFLSLYITEQLIEYQTLVGFSQTIRTQNLIYIQSSNLKEIFSPVPLAQTFDEFSKPSYILSSLTETLNILSSKKNLSSIEREATSQLCEFVSNYQGDQNIHPFIKDIKSFELLFLDFINGDKINFKGDPNQGLQIMGLLETRALDFETVIITSLNEGILPAGKSVNSLIPFDVKKEFGLPTVKEKDAIYAYHFYRLLQRSKDVHLVYNTEPDILNGGEPSRFIHQIMTDPNLKSIVSHQYAYPKLNYRVKQNKVINKTPLLIEELEKKAQNGFSPSSLSDYIKNPYLFYKRHIMKIVESEDVDENIAYNVLGTIIHDTLESLYQPLLNQVPTEQNFDELKKQLEPLILFHFEKYYEYKSIFQGKNLIVFNVILKYLNSVIEKDRKLAENNNFRILSLEEPIKMDIHLANLEIRACIKGKLDRMDEVNGKTRILDYKTGNITDSSLKIKDIEELFTNPKYVPSFQLLCYVLMKKHAGVIIDQAGIMPVKKIYKDTLFLTYKKETQDQFTDAVLETFESRLKLLYEEILNPSIPFEDTGL